MAWLYQRAGSNHWWMGWRANGRQFLMSTGTDDREKAEAQLAEKNAMAEAARAKKLTEAFYESLTGVATVKRTLHAEVADWLNDTKASIGKGTLARYKGIVGDFLAFHKADERGPLMDEIATEHVRAYLNDKRERASVSTVNLERKILSGVFLRAARAGRIKANPVAAIKKFKATGNEVERRNFTLPEIGEIFAKAPNDFWRYMVIGGFYTGLREGDLICLDWRKVDFKESVLRWKTAKTDKAVTIPIHSRFMLELRAEHDRRGKPTRGHLWPAEAAKYKRRGASPFSRQFYKILAECKLVEKRGKDATKNGQAARREINEVSFHSLRHSFITTLNATNATNLAAKELAGHSSDLVNSLYTHAPLDLLVNAVNGLPEVTR